MEFPKTYVDSLGLRVETLKNDIALFKQDITAGGKIVTTGTTVIALLSEDKKTGIIASDGRVSSPPLSAKEDFNKIFDCRVGFIGVAGAVFMVQRIMPKFRANLDEFCDSRSCMVTASGAARFLHEHYFAVGGQVGEGGGGALLHMLALFWDHEEKRCHLYQFSDLCRIDFEHAAAIGSGSILTTLNIDEYGKKPLRSKEEIKGLLRDMFFRVAKKDQATNNHLFYGVISDGEFSMEKEVL